MNVRIITDSTCDIPQSMVKQLGITVVPLTVLVDGQPVLDDDSEPRETRYEQIRLASKLSTSQPSPGQFLSVYRSMLERGLDVISVHISSALSGTWQSASMAASMVSGKVEVVDTGTSSMAMGFAVIEAAKAAARGWSRAEVLERFRSALASTHAFFSVGSLSHLQRIGRLGRVQAIIGTLLDAKPILCVRDGKLTLKERLRGEAAAHRRLVELIGEHVPSSEPIKCAIVHIGAAEATARLREQIEKAYRCSEMLVTRSAATMAAAVGPGSIGLFFAPADS